MAETISSPSNQTIKLARSLRNKKARDESGLLLVEGILHVGEAASAGWEFDTLIFSPNQLKGEFGQRLVEDLQRKGIRSLPVTENVFESISEKDNPQGIAAIVRQKKWSLEEFTSFKFTIAVVTPQDPGNVGTILRTIDAVGADGLILLDGGVEPFHPSSIRASMGTIFWIPFCSTGFGQFVSWVREGNKRVIGTSSHASINYRSLSLDSRPTALLLGSEQKGLLPDQAAECDELVSIEMRGRASSLNLAVAAGVLLYSLRQ